MPFFSKSRTAQLSRDGLWATCPRSASSGKEWQGHGMGTALNVSIGLYTNR